MQSKNEKITYAAPGYVITRNGMWLTRRYPTIKSLWELEYYNYPHLFKKAPPETKLTQH